MGGCFSKPKPVEVKIEVVIPEKERSKEEMSPNGKASPLIYKVNGTARHYHLEDHPIASNPYHHPKDVVEASVCHVKDLENGQMREVDLGCGKALLIKESGEFHAMGHKCPHYGAPLVKGVLSKGRVRCPWHGACFSISTGDIEDFPGLDSLPRFQVKIEKEKVYIRASKQALQTQRRTKMMAKCISLSNYNLSSTNVLIIGAGAAGLVCAETLRQEGFSDRIVMCTMDRHLPYDRPKLSKSMDSHPEQIALRPKEFFCTYDIEVLTEMQVAAVDIKNKVAVFKDGFKMEYNKLLIATGNTPKALSCKGKEVENVFNIRTPEDANRVVKLATSKNVVIVGASFLGMEVAAYLADKAHSVSLVELEEVPFKKFFGEKVGRAIMKMFENNRVKFYMQTEVSELREQEGKLKEVVLKSGKVLRADVCVVGVGAVPATGFLKQSGINIDSKGFIVVNKMMQTNIPGVFAAGDAVTFPLALRNNKKVNVPHWQMAHMHGRIAALNMLAHGMEISTVPYLWTAMFGKSIRYAGHGEGFDDVVIQGDLDELKFVAFYTKSDEVVAVASMNYDPIVSKVAEVLAAGRTIRKRDVELFVHHGNLAGASEAQLLGMAVSTPLPLNLRRGLVAFSNSLFVNNKTWDSGVAHTYHSAHEVLSSLPLQMMLYFNVYFFPVWCLSEGMMLQLKYHLLPQYYQFLLVTAFLILCLAEGSRLYLGYVGNLQEKVPELAGFLLISFLIQLPLLLFLLTDSHTIRLPLEMAVHSLLLAFLLAEILAALFALKTMTKQLAAQFYLRQFKGGSTGQPGQGCMGGQAGQQG